MRNYQTNQEKEGKYQVERLDNAAGAPIYQCQLVGGAPHRKSIFIQQQKREWTLHPKP